MSYAYDTLDRVTSLSYNDVKTYEYDYNREGQVAREKDYDNNITTEYEYDLAQRLTGAYSSNGLRANYTYDGLNQLIRHDDAVVGASYTYSYDNGGNIVNKYLGMNATRIAKEIYFHAYVYHNRNTLKKMDIYKNKHVKKVVDDIIIRANPATVNNDESAVRLLAYNLLWAVK